MKEFFEDMMSSVSTLLQLLLGFCFICLVMVVFSLPFILLQDEDKPSKYDPADANGDGIVSEGEMEAYEIDPSVQHGGK